MISPLRAFGDGSRLYKLFSTAPLGDGLLRALFRYARRARARTAACDQRLAGVP